MLEYGLKESAAYSANRVLSPTMKNVRLSSNSEEFLEIHYTEDNKKKTNHKQTHLQKEETALTQHVSGSGDNESSTHAQKDTSDSEPNQSENTSANQLNQSAASQLSSQSTIATTPSPICEKSESELLEKDNSVLVPDMKTAQEVTKTNSDLSQRQSPNLDLEKEAKFNSDKVAESVSKNEKSASNSGSLPSNELTQKSADDSPLTAKATATNDTNHAMSDNKDTKSNIDATTTHHASITLPDPHIVTHTTQPQPGGNSPLKMDQSATPDFNLSQTISKDTLTSEGTWNQCCYGLG